MDNESSNKRIARWDNLKFVLILLVVVGHYADRLGLRSFKTVYLFIYAFHMPLFLFVSGLFFRAKDIRRRVIYYICCGFALKIFMSVVKLILYERAEFELLGDSGLPWFFFVLAAYQILMYLLRDVNEVFLLVMSILLACFVGYDQTVGNYLYLSRTVVFFPFFLSGKMLTRERADRLVDRYGRRLIPVAAACLAGWFCMCYFAFDTFYVYRHLFNGKLPFSDAVASYGTLARLLCYAISVVTGASVVLLVPRRRLPMISDWGARTENVYFWHYGFLLFLEEFGHVTDLCRAYAGKIGYLMIPVVLTAVLSAVGFFGYPMRTIRKYCYERKNAGEEERKQEG